jgi:hypothetical protein
MHQLDHEKLTKAGEIPRSSAEAEEQQSEASNSFTAAVESERLAGKMEPQGVQSLDGKRQRTDMASSSSDDQFEEVMKKSDKKREVLKKRPGSS